MKEKVLVVAPTTASRLPLLKEVLGKLYLNTNLDIKTIVVKNGTYPNDEYENFDFGVSYAFAFQDLNTTYRYAPRIFDLYLSFDFSPFLRNRRGQYKRLQVNNYF